MEEKNYSEKGKEGCAWSGLRKPESGGNKWVENARHGLQFFLQNVMRKKYMVENGTSSHDTKMAMQEVFNINMARTWNSGV